MSSFGHELFNSKSRERSRSPSSRQYRESPRRSHSVNEAYAQLQPPRPKYAAGGRSREIDTSHSPRRRLQELQLKPMNRDASYMSASAEPRNRKLPSPPPTRPNARSERRREIDTDQASRGRMQERQSQTIDQGVSNISATAEAGSRRSPSPFPTPRSERRRITRREARKRRDGIKNNTAGDRRWRLCC
jgi:hypothetical protein